MTVSSFSILADRGVLADEEQKQNCYFQKSEQKKYKLTSMA
ncbi:hypothetical protein GbCGDNIH3_5116 [Granulibacter bethesdensis]|uniref:Uncharacterized protein n=1 Tax=Granulibacter bethesdensis TaxID=364410 RepID=A0AAN0RG67_9PROT|nr:hypothetical protein GbCGDNIH3_5116 [Granulibacter bethesdensis]